MRFVAAAASEGVRFRERRYHTAPEGVRTRRRVSQRIPAMSILIKGYHTVRIPLLLTWYEHRQRCLQVGPV